MPARGESFSSSRRVAESLLVVVQDVEARAQRTPATLRENVTRSTT